MLLNEDSFGRYKLSKYLGLSKAKTRAILEFLTEHDLAVAQKGRGGTKLTTKGYKLVTEFRNYCKLDWGQQMTEISPDLLPEATHKAVIYMNIADKQTTGLYERDMAVRAGAAGAITLIRSDDGSTWEFPDLGTTDQPEHPPDQVTVIDPTMANSYNILSIAFGDTIGVIYPGIVSIVMYHLSDKLVPLLPDQD